MNAQQEIVTPTPVAYATVAESFTGMVSGTFEKTVGQAEVDRCAATCTALVSSLVEALRARSSVAIAATLDALSVPQAMDKGTSYSPTEKRERLLANRTVRHIRDSAFRAVRRELDALGFTSEAPKFRANVTSGKVAVTETARHVLAIGGKGRMR